MRISQPFQPPKTSSHYQQADERPPFCKDSGRRDFHISNTRIHHKKGANDLEETNNLLSKCFQQTQSRRAILLAVAY